MAASLYPLIASIFDPYYDTGGVDRSDNSLPHDDRTIYMEVPIDKPFFEVPVCLMRPFISSACSSSDTTSLVACFHAAGYIVPYYKSFSRYRNEVLINHNNNMELIRLNIKQASSVKSYYATTGIIFDHDFNLIMLCTWEIERLAGFFQVKRPVLHISPSCYLSQANSLEKFLVKSLLRESLTTRVSIDIPEREHAFVKPVENAVTVCVKIDNNPFRITQATAPSMSVTNRELLDTALAHLDDIVL